MAAVAAVAVAVATAVAAVAVVVAATGATVVVIATAGNTLVPKQTKESLLALPAGSLLFLNARACGTRKPVRVPQARAFSSLARWICDFSRSTNLCYTTHNIVLILSDPGGLYSMSRVPTGPEWPAYTFIIPQIYTQVGVRLVGLGNYTPTGTITNEFFASISTRLGDPRTAEDLERVTGLETRHVRASTLALCRQMAGTNAPGLIDGDGPADETLVDMAVVAARRALASAGREVSEIDTVIGASSSDNDGFPTVAAHVATRLGLGPVRATMLKGACACQTEAFQICAEILAASSAKLVLLVATEGLLPNIMNVLDWKTSSLFGEGAAAFLLERSAEPTYVINGADASLGPTLLYQTPLRKDVVEMAEVDLRIRQLYQDGNGAELSKLLGQYLVGYTRMNGREVYRTAPRAMAESLDALQRHARIGHEEIAHIIPHQANSRITRRLGELLVNDFGWPESTQQKLVDNFRYYGNLSNASIATALIELIRQHKIHDGQWIALPAVGGGLNYGCWLLRYHEFANMEAIYTEASFG
ncbi:MAG TPA: 3-oxoacyl-[acyl-carrier-protein] synthase III C-terminal domain-containing protein, partial [Ktedonobacteraceae bacterium]